MKQPTLAELTAFLHVAEHLSFRRAAVALGLSPSALSHTIRGLEARLGAPLINRTTRSVALTEAGLRLAERLRPAVTSIAEAISELAEDGDRLVGRICISTMEYGGRLLIGDVIGEFQASHPEVEFEICVDHALVDIVGSGCDAGVRFRDQVPPDMVAVPIGPPVSMVAFASPGYLDGRTHPAVPSDLLTHRCIRQRLATGAIYRWQFECDGRAVAIDPQGPLTCNNLGLIVLAALRGLGIGFAPSHHVRPFLESGELVQLLAEFSPSFEGHCLYYPRSRHRTRTFAAFIEHVRSRSGSIAGGAGQTSPRMPSMRST
ncbi:LysR family transcriptional regulator [Arenibaculum pallidiluteum]|uniref:LysR family transcriptional regulator n=1 Tax=Arenibaculum pallidiluteum TaxID=2812559 RepID=UPI001A967D02|nr:LysR family transcriptional regulator [Arenibaculum pallidiluteum]